MNLEKFFGKRTWIGVCVSFSVIMVFLLLGALFLVRGIVPMKLTSLCLCLSYGAAALTGGCVAAAGQKNRVCALLPGVVLYVTAWLAALCSENGIDFSANGIGITVAVAVGIGIACLSCGKKKKYHRGKIPMRPPVKTVRR